MVRNISSTLGLAVCDMAIQMSESWESPVESFINYYKSNRLSLEMVLFLLETLPEETSNNRLILIPEHHTKITMKLKSEYVKVVEFLSLVRNNLTQLTSALATNNTTSASVNSNALNYKMLGKILKVWNNWKRFDTFSTSDDVSRRFLNDCLEIVRNPRLRDEGLEEETYEISVDCIVDSLQECAYLRDKEAYGHSHQEYEYERSETVSATRYNELVELQKACFNVLVNQMQPHLQEAFEKRDVSLYINLSRLFVNLVDSVNIDYSTTDSDLARLMEYLLKLIALPYLLMYSGSGVSKFANPFTSEYSHAKCREILLKHLEGLSKSTFASSNSDMSGPIDLDDEVCNISQKSVYALVDILSKFSKSLGSSLSSVQSVSALGTIVPGLLPYLVSNILELLMLVSLPPYRQYVYSNTSGHERMNYTEHIDNYSYYLSDLTDVYHELLRIVGRNAAFEYMSMNLLNYPQFTSSITLIQSSFVLIPPCISITTAKNGSPRASVVVSKTPSVQAVEKLIVVIGQLLSMNTGPIASQSVHENILLLMAKIDAVRFLGSVRKIFSVPDTNQVLKGLFMMLTKQITAEITSGSDLEYPSSEVLQDTKDLLERLKYESGYNISLLCYHVKMEKVHNSGELLGILLSSLENVDNELMVMMLEGLAISCYNLNSGDLMTVFNELMNNTLAQLTSVVNSVAANTAITSSTITRSDRALIVKLLNRIVGFVRNLKNRPELEPVVGERIIPVLLNLLRIFYLDTELVEVICRCIKHNARVLDVQFSKYIPATVQTISTAAQVKMVGTYLYLIEWLHSIFYSTETNASKVANSNHSGDRGEIMNLYGLLTRLTLNIFKSSYNNYSGHPGGNNSITRVIAASDGGISEAKSQNDLDDGYGDDNEMLVEDFYGLQAEFFLNSDVYLNDLETINEIIGCSCKFMFIRRPQCVFYFWESLLKMSRKNQEVSALASRYLQTVVNNCFRILQEACSKSTEHYVEDLMSAIASYVRSSHFALPNSASGTDTLNQTGQQGNAADRERYLELLFTNGLNCLPAEIIGNEKLKQSFLNGLIKKTTSTVNHIYKLLSKLSMRNRM
ncbi:hypothetical protein MACK_001310 [Theileria orientalis]|uniref:Exportin-1/Importin-beta-like domain-containing protein n=1 Tax=Theileria orientalis TaxID=68886 RepID=A0A976MEM8_THEOR|nr:hypothetical protein MACK_001310 [Theileria orientalis]